MATILLDPAYFLVDFLEEKFKDVSDSVKLPEISYSSYARLRSPEPAVVISFTDSTKEVGTSFETDLTLTLHPCKKPEGESYKDEPNWMSTILQLALTWIQEAKEAGALKTTQIREVSNAITEDGEGGVLFELSIVVYSSMAEYDTRGNLQMG